MCHQAPAGHTLRNCQGYVQCGTIAMLILDSARPRKTARTGAPKVNRPLDKPWAVAVQMDGSDPSGTAGYVNGETRLEQLLQQE